MEEKNKNKIIIGLLIALVVLISNNLLKDKDEDNKLNSNNIGIISSNDDDFIDLDDKDNEEKNLIEDKKVYITGEIKNSGVYTINEGDRLDDLIKKAGGLTEEANTKDINLAMKLEDQMKIYIANKNEIIDQDINESDSVVTLLNSNTTSELVNINTASKEELMSLPNIGEKRADAIIEYRSQNKFENIEDIKNVTGIGEKFFQAMKDLITV